MTLRLVGQFELSPCPHCDATGREIRMIGSRRNLRAPMPCRLCNGRKEITQPELHRYQENNR